MISPELTVRIRHLFFAEHWKIGTIAAELGIHWDTVRTVIESDRFNNKHFCPITIWCSPMSRQKITQFKV